MAWGKRQCQASPKPWSVSVYFFRPGRLNFGVTRGRGAGIWRSSWSGIELLGKGDACLPFFHPGDSSSHTELALAKKDRRALDRQLVALDQRAIGAEVTQLDWHRRARQLKAGRHQHV